MEFVKDTKTGEWRVYTRTWEPLEGVTPRSLLIDKEHGRNRDGTQELSSLLGPKVFTNPKPTKLLRHLVKIGASVEGALVLDFFAGSGSMHHAIMLETAHDGLERRCISIQLAENTGRTDYTTIAEICKERLRRAGEKTKSEGGMTDATLDLGFRVFKIDKSNMMDIYYSPDEQAQVELLDQVRNIKPDRSAEDLLFQVFLDWGVDLALPITRETILGHEVYFVDKNSLAACFEVGLDLDFVKELAKRKPLRAVFHDAGFASDDVKINVEQIFKLISPETEVKTI